MDNDKLNNIALLKHFLSEETDRLTSTESLVALCLAIHRNNISMLCCPSITTIQKRARMARSTVVGALTGLIQKKEIIRLRIKKENSTFANNQYYFFFDIKHAIEIYDDEDSIFRCHHEAQAENFEWCLSRKMFGVVR